jgi:hypothetical protein
MQRNAEVGLFTKPSKLQYGLYKYRNWGMHGEKALHPRIVDRLSDSELQLSGEFVDYFDLT